MQIFEKQWHGMKTRMIPLVVKLYKCSNENYII